MALNIPTSLLNLPGNCGVFAVWMVLQHHAVHMQIEEIIKLCRHDREQGTFTIALAVALQKIGFTVEFYSDDDPDIDEVERAIYQEARQLNIPVQKSLSYAQIQAAIVAGKMAIVFYDTLDEVGHQSLVYSIDADEICFFDDFEAMPAAIFEKQRKAEGICQQVILIDDRHFQLYSATLN